MLVYGERPRVHDPRLLLDALRKRIAAFPLSSRPQPQSGGEPGPPRAETRTLAAVPDRLSAVRDDKWGKLVQRHAALVAALIEAGELAQGLADAAFAARGVDGPDPASDAAMGVTLTLAHAVVASWRGGFDPPDLAPVRTALASLAARLLPAAVTVKVGEGYAFYALYPEAYAEAAAALAAAPTTVIGLRSIGTSLSAVVAAALDAPAPFTLRPVGHPFRRTLSLAPEGAAALADPARRYVVVDEGPGLSGSSFGAVLDALEQGGVARERIVVFPSHSGDLGPQADPAHRARWARLDRRTVEFERLILHAPDPAHRLEAWVADLTGPATAPLEDVSGGAWRRLTGARETDWPPSHTRQERRKYRLRSEAGDYLLKFAGLGRSGTLKLERARALAAAGFTPEPLGLRHGFLVERWIEDAPPGRPTLARIAAYLTFRARAFPAGRQDGAAPSALFEMALANGAEALGAEAARRAERWRPALPRLDTVARPVFTDGRMHRWEWIVGPDGRALKTDALDHADAHDLVGAQDVAWDVAGAAAEFTLTEAQAERLSAGVALASGRTTDPGLAAFMAVAYPAFQLGLWTMAAQAHGGSAEHARLLAACERYAARLDAALARGAAST